MQQLGEGGVKCSVHWRPLHLHPYYRDTCGWRSSDLPVASGLWPRLISLPLFSAMQRDEIDDVVRSVKQVVIRNRKRRMLAFQHSH